ncbi:MAG: tetratricopeptide repeat protein [Elusimicrobia bacterium]|nr:tetratricopeptide repeat protein [Elusimicrobiota bacterium]
MKYLLILLGLYGAYWYVAQHYEFHDTLVYAKKHPQASWSQPTEYYIGLAYYQRADYQKSQEAFSQLLTDFPTGQYEAPGLMHLEDSAEYNHDWETARTAAKQYLDDFPNGKDIEIMRKRMEMLNYQHPGSAQ